MNLAEIFGYFAAGLVLATFSMRTMLPLRILGISSNLAFMTYGYLGGLLPVFVLHAILLPLNVYRFFEMYRLIREFRGADSSHGLDALLPFMQPVSFAAGTTIFRAGEPANDMYLLTSGGVRLEEFDVDIGPGETIGEVGMFAPDMLRMATAVCREDCRLQRISREHLRELVFENPQIGFHLIGVVTARLLEDVRMMERRGCMGPDQIC
jgi:CRP/FNR family transcriptional regulator, cyclic AMP receptor protein